MTLAPSDQTNLYVGLKPFNPGPLRQAWTLPRPDTWVRADYDQMRWKHDLGYAVEDQDHAKIRALVNDGADLNIAGVRQWSSETMPANLPFLGQAAWHNDVATMVFLVQQGADMWAPMPLPSLTKAAASLLSAALCNDSLEAAQWLLDQGLSWESVDSNDMFVDLDLTTQLPRAQGMGQRKQRNRRCMNAWLTTWNRPWKNNEEAAAWVKMAICWDDRDLLHLVLQRPPQQGWSEIDREKIWVYTLLYDRDNMVADLLDANLVPLYDHAVNMRLGTLSSGFPHEMRKISEDVKGVDWWNLSSDVPMAWGWMVVQAGARRIAERWLNIPEEIAAMRDALAKEPLSLLPEPDNNRVKQSLIPIVEISHRIDLTNVRDEYGNTPLHRWVGKAMETPELLMWTAQTFPEWGDVRNHAGQDVWAFAAELKRNVSSGRRLAEAKTLWEVVVLHQGADQLPAPTQVSAPRSRL